MIPVELLSELLTRLGASNEGAVFVSGSELSTWPSDSVAALQTQRLLMKARPADSVVCGGCEQACTMLVNTVTASGREPRRFVVCDKRSDVGRVPVTLEQLTQWRCDEGSVVKWIATELSIRQDHKRLDASGMIEIGMVEGRRRHQMVCLRNDGALSLVAGTAVGPLAEYVRYSDGRYTLDRSLIQKLADSSATSDPRYTPSRTKLEARKLATNERHAKWQRAYRDLRTQTPNKSDVWYSLKIARSPVADGCAAETIRRHMKR